MNTLYLLDIRELSPYRERALPLLSGERRDRVLSAHSEVNALRSLGAGLLLRHYVGPGPFSYGEYGKPFLPGGPPFSLSHGGDLVVLAVAAALLLPALGATLAGSVYGDHCSPISDTTILASTGADCMHIRHVETQLPYATLVAVVCAVGYLIAGFTLTPWISIVVATLLLIGAVVFLSGRT